MSDKVLTDWSELRALAHLSGQNTASLAALTTHLGLSVATTDPTEAGANFTEPSTVNAYARQPMTTPSNKWNAPVVGTPPAAAEITNSLAVTFPICTTADWGIVKYVGLFDAATAGNLIMWAQLDASRDIKIGDRLELPATTGLKFTLD